jgi:hypothetical protein
MRKGDEISPLDEANNEGSRSEIRRAECLAPATSGGAFDPHNPAPVPLDLENGILKDVAIAPPDGRSPSLVEIKLERHDGKLETRDLWVDGNDVAMVLKLYSVLKGCKGRSLREVRGP